MELDNKMISLLKCVSQSKYKPGFFTAGRIEDTEYIRIQYGTFSIFEIDDENKDYVVHQVMFEYDEK